MSDTETMIQPALTPEEWTEVKAHPGLWVNTLYYDIFAGNDEGASTGFCPSEHGRAAISLYGQPFGFTQEDVEALVSVADYSGEGSIAPEEDIARARSAIQRLAALLPKT